LMQQEHTNELSAGPQLLHTILQQQFWVMWAKNAICLLVYKCVICHCHWKQMSDQQMTDFQHPKPFSHCGVDYTGPFNVKPVLGGSHQIFKGYIVLFVCFVLQQLICN
jgi:hypothetical protein